MWFQPRPRHFPVECEVELENSRLHRHFWELPPRMRPTPFPLRIALLLLLIALAPERLRATVLITEFMADNIRTLADENGDHPDWIELYNAGTTDVNLAGWYLTDDPLRLDRWQFPPTNLPPQKHLLVYASNKDRAVSGAPLHTNFRLSAAADYIALVRPDGVTVESATPSPFPQQVPDVSSGIAVSLEATTLVPVGASARFLVPKNSFLESIWRDLETDDSVWDAVTTGVGYEAIPNRPEPGQVADSVADFDGSQGSHGWYYGYYNKTTDPNANYQTADFNLFPNADDTYGAGNFWNGTTWKWAPANPPWTEIGAELMRPTGATGTVHEHWPIRRWISDSDGTYVVDWRLAKLVSGGGGVTIRVAHKGATKDTATIAGTDLVGTNRSVTITGVKAGDPIEFLLTPSGTGGNATDEGDLASVTTKISRLASLDADIATSVADKMKGQGASAWVRIAFNVDDPAAFQRLVLRLKYDDGFVAWLNGVEVAHDNAPTDLHFDSAATASRPDSAAIIPAEFDLTARLGTLHPGVNLLAIQGLNASAGDDDFLLVPELVASRVTFDTSQLLYLSPPTPGVLNGPGSPKIGPLVLEVDHTPHEPADNQDLNVTARVVRTLGDIANVSLRWRIMFGTETTSPMFDDGAHGDGAPNDGIWGATIPSNTYTNGQMIRWYVMTTDKTGNTNSLPAYPDPKNSPRYFGAVVKDITLTNRLPVLHQFIQTPSGADSSSGTRCSIYYLGNFYDNVAIGLHGQSSAGFPKHSYNVDFNRGYGFQYEPGSPRVDDINLLTTWPDKAKVRNVLAYETHRDAGYAYHYVIPVRVQRNAQFFGDWHIVEDGGEEYLDRVGLSPRGALYKMYDTFASANPSAEKKTRKTEPNADLAELYKGISRSGAAKTQYLYDNVDIPGMVNYLAIMIMTANVDCCHKNYYAYRDSEGTREWKYLPWDQDLSFGRNWTGEKAYEDDKMYVDNGLQIGNNNTLIAALFGDAKFLSMYNRRIRTLMDKLLQPTNTPPAKLHYEKRIAELAYLIQPDAALDFAKWPTWGQKQTLTQAMVLLTNTYMPGRRKYLYGLAASGKTLPFAQSPTAQVAFGDYEVTPPTGNPAEEYLIIRNPGTNAVDISDWRIVGDIEHTFIPGTVIPVNGSLYLSPDVNAFRSRNRNPRGGQGLFVQGAYKGQLSARGGNLRIMDGAREVAALVLPSNPTPAQKWLRVTEIHFEPAEPPNPGPFTGEDFEFIELMNTGDTALDLSKVRFTDGVVYDFATSTRTNLAPHGTVLVVRNAAAFRSRYGQGLPIAGEYTGRIDNNGERLRVEELGEVVLDFRYPTDFPRAHGQGRSIMVADALAPWTAWNNPLLWVESDANGGTPGDHSSKYALWAAQRFTASELADPAIGGSDADPDGDGESNLREYNTGTDPRNRASYLRLDHAPSAAGGKPTWTVQAVAGKTYTIQVRENLSDDTAAWQKLLDIPAGTDRTVTFTDPDGAGRDIRYYRVVTPSLP